MENANHKFPAWLLFLLILLLGILFMLGAGQVAIQLAPHWNLIADVDSNIDPNDQLILWSNSARIEPVSLAILTQPAWRATYLTPGASIFVPPIAQGIPSSTSEANSTPLPAVTQGPGSSVTPGQPTAGNSSTPVIIIFPSNTVVPKTDVPTKISTSAPTVTPTRTGTATVTATSTALMAIHTATSTGTATVTPTPLASTATSTSTPTGTSTATAMSSDTETPTATATATETPVTPVVLPSACDSSDAVTTITGPAAQDYSLNDTNNNNCLVYQNSAYIAGGSFTIKNGTSNQVIVHYKCSGSNNFPLDANATANVNVSIDGSGYMIVRIVANNGGTINVKVDPASAGSCP